MRTPLLLLSLFLLATGHAQTFTNVAFDEGIVVQVAGAYVGCGATVYDFNGDGLDDITLCSPGNNIHFYQNFGEYLAPPSFSIENSGEAKMALWGDYDNDGDADLLITKSFDQTRLYRNDGDGAFVDITSTCGMPLTQEMRSYGAAWGDYDRDGLLDLYICNYNFNGDITNYLLHNEGGDLFTEVQVELGVTNEIRPSFQPVFTDFNHDLWPDLYVINDKIHPNVMYVNNGDGTFSDASLETATGLIIDAMSNSWSDFDHDGDLDVYVSNATAGNKLLVNQENAFFVESATEFGVEVFSICWGALWIDYNNDSWDDLHVTTTINGFAGNQNFFFENQEGALVENLEGSGIINDTFSSYSSARGDINNDGYSDLLISTEAPDYITLWENSGGANNWAKLTLEGTVSNRDGIGSWVTWYTNGSPKQYYTISGDNYMGQSTQHHICGLGLGSAIDSVQVEWPSGWIDTWYDLPEGQDHTLREGSSFVTDVSTPFLTSVCQGDSVLLTLPAGDWTWNNGLENDSLWASDSGYYWASYSPLPGLAFTTDSVSITVNPLPQASWTTSPVTCFGGSNGAIQFESGEQAYFLVDSDSTSVATQGLPAGTYDFLLSTLNGCTEWVSIPVSAPQLLTADVSGVVSQDGLSAEVSVEALGGTEPYSYFWANGSSETSIVVDQTGSYSCLIADGGGCFAASEWTWEAASSIHSQSAPLTLWPNPTSGWINYSGPSGIMRIYTTSGQLVHQTACINGERISLAHLPKGIYVLKVESVVGNAAVRLQLL